MSDFEPGDRVRYIPGHAHGDPTHPDCEDGIVRGRSENFYFVVYDNPTRGVMATLADAERWTAAATLPDDLIRLPEQESGDE
jgi:hypothetical protein